MDYLTPPVVRFIEIPLCIQDNRNQELVDEAILFCKTLNDFLWDLDNGEPILSGVHVGTASTDSIYLPRYGPYMNTAIFTAITSVKSARLLSAILLGISKAGTPFDYMAVLEDALSAHMPTTTTK